VFTSGKPEDGELKGYGLEDHPKNDYGREIPGRNAIKSSSA
jgi:hypothetical protein